jgi:hypothetical protein
MNFFENNAGFDLTASPVRKFGTSVDSFLAHMGKTAVTIFGNGQTSSSAVQQQNQHFFRQRISCEFLLQWDDFKIFFFF